MSRLLDGVRVLKIAAFSPVSTLTEEPARVRRRPMVGIKSQPSRPLVGWPAMRLRQKYRMRAPSTGREVIIQAEPDEIYVDRATGEPLEVVAMLLPLAPTASELPWTIENLRFCNWCDELTQKDLNDCPHCGRRMEPLGS